MKFQPQEIQFLYRSFDGRNIGALARALGRTESSIFNKLYRLGLLQDRFREDAFTAEEDAELLAEFDGNNLCALAEKQGRSALSVRRRLQHLYRQGEGDWESAYIRARREGGSPTLFPSAAAHPHLRRQYRPTITDTVRMQLCIADFERLSPQRTAALFAIHPACLPRMIEAMKKSGMYGVYIRTFRFYNPKGYERAVLRQQREKGGV